MIANLFRKIDGFVFEQMLKVKTTQGYSKIQELFNDLEDHLQQRLKAAMIALCVIVPLIVVVILFIGVKSSEDNVAMYKESLERVRHYTESRTNLNRSGVKFLAKTTITSQSDFTNRITLAANAAGVDLANIEANDFATETLPGDIQKNIIAIKFNKLSSNQFFSMIISLAEEQYIKFENIEIKRNKETSLIQGLVTLNHFSKAPIDESN